MISYNKNMIKNLVVITIATFLIIGDTQVNAQNTNLNIQKRIVSLKLGQVSNINYNETNEDDIQYHSQDRMVATVDVKGNIIGNMIGSTTVVGEKHDGARVETTVIVYRDILEPLGEIQEPRFKIKDGIYVNESAEKTDEALLMFTGDLMCQTRQQERAKTEDGTYIFNDSFSMVKDIFAQADFVTGNFESILSNNSPYMSEEKALGGLPHLNAPSTYLDALRYAGFDLLATSNNHTADDGERGLLQTLDLLEKYKFAYTGSFRDENEQRFIMVDLNGIKVAIMSYSEKFNGKDVTIDEDKREIMINRYTKEAAERDVKKAREMGAEYIIAYNHWGVEYTNEYNEAQANSAKEMANTGIDFIVGSHPHALQTLEVITTDDNRQVPVIYSMGNFVSHQYKDVTKDTLILTLNLKRDESGKVYLDETGFIPCHVLEEHNGIPYLVTPISKEFNGGVEHMDLDEAYIRIQNVINGSVEEIKSYEEINN